MLAGVLMGWVMFSITGHLKCANVKCPSGMTHIVEINKCLIVNTEELDFEDAERACRLEFNATLFRDTNLINHLALDRLHMEHDIEPWIGLSDRHTEGTFRWADGKNLKRGDFQEWNYRYYNKEENDCVALTRPFYNWAVVDCDKEKPLICEIADVNPCKKDNGGCGQLCTNVGIQKSVCSCNPGFQLKPDMTCAAIIGHDCSKGNGGCQHICGLDARGFVVCSCLEGYELHTGFGRGNCTLKTPCQYYNGDCDHICNYIRPGVHQCQCNLGYKVSPHDPSKCMDIAPRDKRYIVFIIVCNAFMILVTTLTVYCVYRHKMLIQLKEDDHWLDTSSSSSSPGTSSTLTSSGFEEGLTTTVYTSTDEFTL